MGAIIKLALTNNEIIDLLFDMLIKVMIKNGYEVISIDQIIAIKHEFKRDPLIEVKN